MRVQLAILLLLFSALAKADTDKEMQELFTKYGQIMLQKKTNHIEDVFSQKFLERSGGKITFEKKIEASNLQKSEKVPSKIIWKKGKKDEVFLAKFKASEDTQFIIVKENGKLKIDGTASDAD